MASSASGGPPARAGLRASARSVAMASSGNELDMWRIERARLQEGYVRELLRRPRRYLPFVEARRWARAMWFTDADDWLAMLERGEKRNPYLPRRPDVYYADKGWVSWHDFFHDPPE